MLLSVAALNTFGRSARTYTTEGDWDRLKPFIKFVFLLHDLTPSDVDLQVWGSSLYGHGYQRRRYVSFKHNGGLALSVRYGLGWPPEDGYHRNDLSDEDPDATIVVIKEGKNETVHTYQW